MTHHIIMRDYLLILTLKTRLTSQAEWEKILHLVFDLETTGLSMINLASIIIDHEGITIEDSIFHSLVKPQDPIFLFIS